MTFGSFKSDNGGFLKSTTMSLMKQAAKAEKKNHEDEDRRSNSATCWQPGGLAASSYGLSQWKQQVVDQSKINVFKCKINRLNCHRIS